MEYFYRSQNYIIIGCLISIFFFVKTNQILNKEFALTVLLFLLVETLQYTYFGGFNFRTFLGTYTRLFLAYSVIQIVKHSFFKIYTSIIYFFATISLIFYGLTFIPGISDFYINTLGNLIPNLFSDNGSFYAGSKNIIIFNFHEYALKNFRNSGPFWEPGALAVFLLLALVFNQTNHVKFLTKKNIIFIIATLTTFSTTGYICLFLFLIYVNFNSIRTNVLFVLILIISIVGIFLLYEKIPFLKDKIEKDIEYTNETTTSRFGSALADYNQFKESPLFGYGRAGAKNNFVSQNLIDVDNHRNNGVFNLLATYGVVIFFYYFFKIIKSFKLIGVHYNLPSYYYIFSFLILLLLGFSQGLFMRPFFYTFLFTPMIFLNKQKISKSNQVSVQNNSLQKY